LPTEIVGCEREEGCGREEKGRKEGGMRSYVGGSDQSKSLGLDVADDNARWVVQCEEGKSTKGSTYNDDTVGSFRIL